MRNYIIKKKGVIGHVKPNLETFKNIKSKEVKKNTDINIDDKKQLQMPPCQNGRPQALSVLMLLRQ